MTGLECLTDGDWRLLECKAEHMAFGKGDEIIRQGGAPKFLYVLRKGSARVELPNSAPGKVVARLGPGQVFGEMAFLEQDRASATVIADEQLEVDALAIDELRSVFEAFPQLASRFYRSLALTLSRRLRSTSAELAQSMAQTVK